MNPFISESIWTEAVTDLAVEVVEHQKADNYTDETPAGNKAAIRFLHLGIALAPSYKTISRLGEAAFGYQQNVEMN